ncbi:MAG: hypothetical protein CMJ85_05935 [Planctomycetes bacterium]|nr:hypothetical protein [Planctomycetota bacterium]
MQSATRAQTRLGLAFVILATFLAFSPSLDNGFAMDDRAIARSTYDDGRPNPMVGRVLPLGEYFTSHYWRGHKEASDLYRPVTVLSYALCNAAGRDEASQAFVQHAVNLTLHLIATLAVFLLARSIRLGPIGALVAAGGFGVHALHSEAVAAVSGRAELLAFCFGALGTLAFASRRRLAGGTVAAALLFLALCSKESAIAWIGFLAVHTLARHEAIPLRLIVRAAWQAALVAVLALGAFLVLRDGALAETVAGHRVLYLVNPIAHEDTGTRLITAISVLGLGLYKTVLPFSLSSDYGVAVLPILHTVTDWRFLLAVIVLVTCLYGGLASVRRRPPLFVATAIFFGFSFLTSNVPIAIGTMFGERLYYTPCLGFAVAAAWVVTRPKRWRVAAFILLGVWSAASIVVARDRSASWRDNRTLFLRDAETQPRSARLLVGAAAFAPPTDKARMLERAIALFPGYPTALANLAGLRQAQQKRAEAEELLQKALDSPHLDESREGFRLRMNLMLVLVEAGRLGRARTLLDDLFARYQTQVLPQLGGFLGAASKKLAASDRLGARDLWQFVIADQRFPPGLRKEAQAALDSSR